MLVVVILLAAGVFWWLRSPAPLLWSDIREGDGTLLSLVAGKDALGNEIVVAGGYIRTDDTGRDLRILCYDATDGHVRWEVREDQELPKYIETKPILTMDAAGDVLVGWEMVFARQGTNKAVSKYAGVDGRLLWSWNMEDAMDGSFLMAIPVAAESGALWVSGFRDISGACRRFVAALDPNSGRLLWQHDLNECPGGIEGPVQIHHLKDGGAILLVHPQDDGGVHPWLIQHRSGADGELRWQQEIRRDDERFHRDLCGLVDEVSGQLLISMDTSSLGHRHLEVMAFDLTSGVERWHHTDIIAHMSLGQYGPSQAHRSCYGYAAGSLTHGRDGGIELWGTIGQKTLRTKWWRWRMDGWVPRPELDNRYRTQEIRVTLSPSDGSYRDSELLAAPMENALASLARPGGDPERLILREAPDRKLSDPSDPVTWRADGIADSSRGILPSRKPAGIVTSGDFPEHAALTPSGRLVIGGDPAHDKRQWQIRVW